MSERVWRYQQAMLAMDIDALATLRHAEYECFMPQSGEHFVGHEAWAEAHRDYLSHFGEAVEVDAVRGGDQHATVARVPIVMPFAAAPVVQVADTGDLVTIEGKGRWPDGKVYHFVFILEYREGLVRRETQYYAEPFPAPEWRARFTAPPDR